MCWLSRSRAGLHLRIGGAAPREGGRERRDWTTTAAPRSRLLQAILRAARTLPGEPWRRAALVLRPRGAAPTSGGPRAGAES